MVQIKSITDGKNYSGKNEYFTYNFVFISNDSFCENGEAIGNMAKKVIKLCMGWQKMKN